MHFLDQSLQSYWLFVFFIWSRQAYVCLPLLYSLIVEIYTYKDFSWRFYNLNSSFINSIHFNIYQYNQYWAIFATWNATFWINNGENESHEGISVHPSTEFELWRWDTIKKFNREPKYFLKIKFHGTYWNMQKNYISDYKIL